MSRADPPHEQVPLTVGREPGLVSRAWYSWFLSFTTGYTGVVPLAKITGGGADGSLTIVNGRITDATLPT